ncbi:MAG TPA: hypothetical protein ENH01_13700 [Nitrospirae bacterium]|nr:hypothetical protein [Nitrospirota bacterium]
MRYLRYISLIILFLILASCGGGIGGSSPDSTTVMINLGQQVISAGMVSSSVIPSSVNSMKFYISGSGMSPVERIVTVAGSAAVEERFEVSNGADRHFEVFSYDNNGSLIYYGDAYATLTGTPTSVSITMIANEIPPTFGGVVTATAASSTEIDLSWTAATDDITQSSDIVYLVYMSTTSGGQNFLSQPDFTTAAGAASYAVTGLFASTTYYFAVRAKDEAGNLENNTVEVSEATLTPTDTTAPTFGGATGATAVSGTEIDLSWTAATDNVTAQSNIVYLIYMSTTSGGQDFLSQPDFTTAAGAVSYAVTGLNSSTTYYFVVRAKDEAGNVDNNTVQVSATTQTPPDSTPPTFGGASTATAVSSAEIDLSWTAATDNVTASSNIVYLIYISTSPGGQDFQTPNYITTAGAVTYAVTGLGSSTTYYFVVRAKDEAGNVDTNTVEVSATTLWSMM